MPEGVVSSFRLRPHSRTDVATAALDALAAAVAVVDEDGVIIFVNEAWRRGDDHPRVGSSYFDYHGARAFARDVRLVLAGEREDAHAEVLQSRGDAPYPLAVRARRCVIDDRPCAVITHTREAQSSQVASTVAHDLNNPLAFAISNLEALREHLVDVPGLQDARDMIADSLAGMARVCAIAEELRTRAPGAQQTPRASTLPPPAREPQDQPRVLVIDDEPMMLRSYKRTLQRSFEVVTCESGRDALERLATNRDFRVVLCDMTMPDIDGQRFYERLESVAPELRDRVVFCTGGACSAKATAFLASVPNPVLDKPTPTAELLATISAVAG